MGIATKLTSVVQNSKSRRTCERKAIVDFHVNETTITDSSLPLDLSFQNATGTTSVTPEGPRESRTGKIPERGSQHRRYLTRSIWLNNNRLTDIRDMEKMVDRLLEQPERLGWIDFSFNYITEIDNSILKFPNLKIVYFHGNQIKDVNEILKLRPLRKLRSVTFHGNPTAEIKNYRSYVVTYLPQISNLDFTPVLREEQLRCSPKDALQKIAQSDVEERRKKREKQN